MCVSVLLCLWLLWLCVFVVVFVCVCVCCFVVAGAVLDGDVVVVCMRF